MARGNASLDDGTLTEEFASSQRVTSIKRMQERLDLKRQAYLTAKRVITEPGRDSMVSELLDRLTVTFPTGEQAIWVLGSVQHLVGMLRGPLQVIEDYERDAASLEKLKKAK